MRRILGRLVLVCFVFSALPLLQAVETPQTRAEAQHRNRKAQKKWNKKHKPAKAKWGGKAKKSKRASR